MRTGSTLRPRSTMRTTRPSWLRPSRPELLCSRVMATATRSPFQAPPVSWPRNTSLRRGSSGIRKDTPERWVCTLPVIRFMRSSRP